MSKSAPLDSNLLQDFLRHHIRFQGYWEMKGWATKVIHSCNNIATDHELSPVFVFRALTAFFLGSRFFDFVAVFLCGFVNPLSARAAFALFFTRLPPLSGFGDVPIVPILSLLP